MDEKKSIGAKDEKRSGGVMRKEVVVPRMTNEVVGHG